MILHKYIMFILILFFFNGCKLLDDMFKFEHTYQQKQNNQYNEIIFQNENSPKDILITSKCRYNNYTKYIYIPTPQEIENNYTLFTKKLLSDPKKKILKPFWDIRYVNKIYYDNNISYADISLATGLDARNGVKNFIAGSYMAQVSSFGSVVESKCKNNKLVAATTINLKDAPEQYVDYAGPQSTFIYNLKDVNKTKIWKDGNGNLMIQAYFNDPIYINYSKNLGANINFGIILKNRKNNLLINYIIGLYTSGEGWRKEQTDIKYDPTTKMIHVATVASEKSIYSTLSPRSQNITILQSNHKAVAKKEWNSFFRVNISYDNLKNVLTELKNNPPIEVSDKEFGLEPKDWQVTSIFIQFEVEEEGGKALLSGSFKGFEAYSSKLPL